MYIHIYYNSILIRSDKDFIISDVNRYIHKQCKKKTNNMIYKYEVTIIKDNARQKSFNKSDIIRKWIFVPKKYKI